MKARLPGKLFSILMSVVLIVGLNPAIGLAVEPSGYKATTLNTEELQQQVDEVAEAGGATANDGSLAVDDNAIAVGSLSAQSTLTAASDNSTAILYSGGDLVLQHGSGTEASRGSVLVTWTGFESTGEHPWTSGDYAKSVKKVVFGDVFRPTTLKGWFEYMYELTTIEGMDKLDTSNVTDMSNLFYEDIKLASIDLSHFNTSKVTDMSGMFHSCSALTQIDVSKFDTSKVTNMACMFGNYTTYTRGSTRFYGCTSLTSLDVSNFDTSNVTNMNAMFGCCSKLEELNLSNFNTSNVTEMYGMFNHCSNLRAVDVKSFDTSNVKDMFEFFERCSKLETVDVSGFDTSKVRSFQYFFEACYALKELDVSGFNTSSAVSMNNMFAYCRSLTKLDVSGFDTSKSTGMYGMFDGCSSLTELDVSGFNTDNVTDMGDMFEGCSLVKNLDVSKFNTSKVTRMHFMFRNCSSIESLDLSGFDTSSLEMGGLHGSYTFGGTDGMFEGCSSLSSITFGAKTAMTQNPDYPQYNAGLPDAPTETPYTGLWERKSDGVAVAAADLIKRKGSDIAGTWAWQHSSAIDLSRATVVLSQTSYTYDGTVKCPSVVSVVLDGAVVPSSSYSVTLPSGCVNAGSYDVTVTGKDGYYGNASASYSIEKASLLGATVTLAQTSYEYDGSVKHPAVTSVTLTSGLAVSSDSFAVSYGQGCTNPGTYVVTVTATGANYTGSSQASFTIVEKTKTDISNATVTLSSTSFTYSGSVQVPSVTSVTLQNGTVLPASAYTVSLPTNSVDAGTYGVTVTGQGDYTGMASASFSIARRSINGAHVTLSVTSFTYNGSTQLPSVTAVSLSGDTALPYGSYSVSYPSQSVNAGAYSVTVSGQGNYSGSASASFTIEKRAITESMIADIPDQAFDGQAVTPSVTVTYGQIVLSSESDYAVTYANNEATGNATATVTAKATSVNFTGSASKQFRIVAKETEVKADRDAWRFNNDGYDIDLHYYTDLYGDSYGLQMYFSLPGNGGVCYGMSAAAFSSSLYGRPSVPSWTNGVNVAAQLYDVGKNWTSAETSTWTKAGTNLSALDYIKYAFLAQADPKMSMQYRSNMKTPGNRNMAELDELVQAINDALAGKRELPVLCIFPNNSAGHAISPLRLGKSTNNADEIVVYDCNHPGEERSLWLYKNSSGAYTGWQYDTGWGVWGTTMNSTARITWEWPSEALPSMFDRKGEFDKNKYEQELWYSRLYSSNTSLTAVSGGKEYSLSPDTTANPSEVAYVPRIAFNPDAIDENAYDLYWTNLNDEVGFKDIAEDAEIGVASSTGGVNLKVAAGSEAIVKVSEDTSNSADIKQNEGDVFEVEYFDDTNQATDGQVDKVKLSGVGDKFVYTQQVGSSVSISGASLLRVTNAEDNMVTMQLDAASTYTVIPSNDDAKPEIVKTDEKAAKPTAKNFTYDGKQHVGVAAGEGYTLSGTAKTTKAGTYNVTAQLKEGWQWADGSKDDVKLTWRIDPKNIKKPTAKNFTYDGKQHVGVAAGEGYTLSGTVKTSKAGTYDVTASLDENYQWSDGETSDVKLTWKIKTGIANGKTATVSGVTYKVKSNSRATILYQKAPKSKKTVTIPKTVVVAGKTYKVVGIAKNAFKGAKAQVVTAKTSSFTESSVKGCFTKSKVTTVKVKVGSASANKKTVNKYKKYFTKKNCGKKVTVK